MEVRAKCEKEELLDKKIEEVRKRNEARLKKFQEAEEDRKRAEEAGCAVNMKKSTFDDDDYFPPRHRGQHNKVHPNKPGSHKTKKYVPGTSEEWKEYIAAKNRSNAERGSNEDNNNNNNDDASPNENTSNSFNNSRKERTPRGNNRAIYIPKQLQNRDSPESVKPPPPDPKNSFLADSFRSSAQVPKPDDTAKVEDQRAFDPRKQQVASPVTPAGSQGTFQGDARQRINQLKALRNHDQSPSTPSTPPNESPNLKHIQNQGRQDFQKPRSYQRSRPNTFKHSKATPPADIRTAREDVDDKEALEKPIKSILKRPKQPNVTEFDVSQPIIAVITTPGDDDDDDDAYEEEVGYSKKKEEAICDWLKQSEFNNAAEPGGDDDDEWEDVDEEEDTASNHKEALRAEGKVKETPAPAPVPVTATTSRPTATTSKTSTTTSKATTTKTGDEDLEAFEEDNAAFQEFIMQHTLTLDKDYDGGFNWATEMERLSLENKQKIDLEAVEKLTLEN